jgi:hypothetical protein
MKGTIIRCLQDMVTAHFGKDKWEKSLQDIGLSSDTIFWPTLDVDDAQVMELVGSLCRNLNLSLEQAADAFGDYWINCYAPKMYPIYYASHTTARDFLLSMNDVHMEMTRAMEDARPPGFSYEWQDDRTLIMHYKSHRGLLDFVVGLAKGVGKYYKENLQVSKAEPDKVRIVFK